MTIYYRPGKEQKGERDSFRFEHFEAVDPSKSLSRLSARMFSLISDTSFSRRELDCQENGVHSKRESELESVLEESYQRQKKAAHDLKVKTDALWELDRHIKKIHREIAWIRKDEGDTLNHTVKPTSSTPSVVVSKGHKLLLTSFTNTSSQLVVLLIRRS
ncbi:nuclear lamin L1 alpha [Culex quinquefasciatus]|uniref:Nuclear lamin L1 alpha n=1 Tax=Culex quinquefasciatus TaxID=7176 RepID=B0XEH1_CULQU|nr:nuclear lamin L1 alpha [Culex quinquefasciatus]|eukprot:XP_001868043.1 nuclear lamin L1 alpha [Culex quinquefasciatus]